VRNILGLVRGLITQSAESAADLGSFVDSLHHRIGTLANAHDLLTSSNWGPASLHALLRTSLEEQIRLIGPDVLLEPRAVAAMAMVVHELVTNARKYGALSNPAGEVIVQTSISEVGNVAISWSETGGPPVARPARRGFGTTILEQVIPFDVSGSTVSHYLPEGFAFDITLPPAVATCIERSAPLTAEAKRPEKPARTYFTSILNVSLVVEDNLFIAIDAEDMLHSLGAAKVVVVKSVAGAHAAIAKQQFSFALLT
jgi:two-component sensor histidine kinase